MTEVLGHVHVKSFGAARGATVEVHNATGDVVDQVVADDDGGFTYYLTPGRWAFRAWDRWGHRGDGELILTDSDAEVRLDLQIG
jgi:hypothetical protein